MDTKPKATTNSDCRQYVMSRTNFKGSNLYGLWQDNIFTVYSWGYHFPMYVYDSQADQWYGNKDKFSQSTSKHQSQARPRDVDIQWFHTSAMTDIAQFGVAAVVARRIQSNDVAQITHY